LDPHQSRANTIFALTTPSVTGPFDVTSSERETANCEAPRRFAVVFARVVVTYCVTSVANAIRAFGFWLSRLSDGFFLLCQSLHIVVYSHPTVLICWRSFMETCVGIDAERRDAARNELFDTASFGADPSGSDKHLTDVVKYDNILLGS
jgi:hypothetical protein